MRTPQRYQRLVEAGVSPEAAGETLDPAARRLEGLQLKLRTRRGVAAGDLEEDPVIDGLVSRRGDRLVLTRAGRLLANEVSLRLKC